MNKRKTTSIALAAAVAISTVQLAYPANVFANEQVSNINIKKSENVNTRTYTVNENEKFTVNLTTTGGLESTLTSMSGYSANNVKSLTISTSNNAVLNEEDFKFIRETLKNILELDLTNANCINNTIPDGAMEGCSTLAKIVLPTRNVNSVGEKAFYNCTGLSEELVIPGNIQTIGESAFASDSVTSNEISNLILSEGVKIIGIYAFQNHKIGGNLNIPSSMEEVGGYSFKNSNFGGTLTFSPNSNLETLGWECFNNCPGFIGELKLSEDAKSLRLVGANFQNCTGFTGDIKIPDNVTKVGNKLFFGCTGFDGTLTLPSFEKAKEDDKVICTGAFQGCTKLKGDIIIPNSVTTIKEGAFRDCPNFNGKVIIPDSVTTIEKNAFYGCKSLTKLEMGKNVTNIGEQAFDECEKLTGKLIIPNNVKSIESSAFINCSEIEVIKFGKALYEIKENAFGRTRSRKQKLHTIDLTEVEALNSVNEKAFSITNAEENKDIVIYDRDSKNSEALTTVLPKEKHIYAITNGGTFDDDTAFEKGKLATPVMKDKAFDGWYTKDGNNNDWGTKVEGNLEAGKTYYAKWSEAVATVDGVGYTDLQTAIDNAEGKTVEVVSKTDIVLEKSININKDNITIKFNGIKVSMKNSGENLINVNSSKDISIINSNFELSGIGRAISVSNGAEVTVKDSEFATKGNAKSAIYVDNATLKIEGKVKTEGLSVVELANKNSNIKVEKDSKINDKDIPSVGESNDIVLSENSDISLSDVINDILGDKDENKGILVEETTTNSIKIKAWDLGLKDQRYGIFKKVTTRNVSADEQVERVGDWKEAAQDGYVVFDGLSSDTEYTIFVKSKDSADDTKIELVKVSTKSNPTSGGGNYIPSKPTYTHEKIEGLNRYETAAKVADELGSYDNVVLVNASSTMSDGLSASGLAGKEDAAILLTKKDSIPKATMDRLKKVKKVYIIGGENAISQKVYNEITKNVPNIKVERIGGKTRVETSELVAKKIGNYSNAFVVNGFKGEADAMSSSSIAARYEAPILLTNGKTSTHDKKTGVSYYVVGGNSVVNNEVVKKYNAKRLAGDDRYETNREVIDEFYSGSDKLYIANGETLVDALTASTIAKNNGIVLVNKKSDNSVLKNKNTVQIGGMNFEIDFEK